MAEHCPQRRGFESLLHQYAECLSLLLTLFHPELYYEAGVGKIAWSQANFSPRQKMGAKLPHESQPQAPFLTNTNMVHVTLGFQIVSLGIFKSIYYIFSIQRYFNRYLDHCCVH